MPYGSGKRYRMMVTPKHFRQTNHGCCGRQRAHRARPQPPRPGLVSDAYNVIVCSVHKGRQKARSTATNFSLEVALPTSKASSPVFVYHSSHCCHLGVYTVKYELFISYFDGIPPMLALYVCLSRPYGNLRVFASLSRCRESHLAFCHIYTSCLFYRHLLCVW